MVLQYQKSILLSKLHDELLAAGLLAAGRDRVEGTPNPDVTKQTCTDVSIYIPDDTPQMTIDQIVAIVNAHDPGPNLADVQAAKIAEIETTYDNALSAGFTSASTGTPLEYDYRPSDRADFQKFTLTMALGIATFPVPIGLKDNSVVNHTQEQYLQLLQDIQAYEWGLKERKRQLVSQVLAAMTVEQVNSIQW